MNHMVLARWKREIRENSQFSTERDRYRNADACVSSGSLCTHPLSQSVRGEDLEGTAPQQQRAHLHQPRMYSNEGGGCWKGQSEGANTGQKWKKSEKWMGLPGGSDGKASACNVGDPGSIPGSGRSPGGGNGNPLQHSCLQNSMDGGAWWATVHGVAKSWTRLSDFTFNLNLKMTILGYNPQNKRNTHEFILTQIDKWLGRRNSSFSLLCGVPKRKRRNRKTVVR